jgi:hypothetical protein
MKKLVLLFLACSMSCFAQKEIDSLKTSDLELPNSPALTLLDKSFSLVEVSNSSNSINANLVNIKDNAVEIVPYWLFKKGQFTSVNAYHGFTVDATDVIIKQNIFNDLKKISISSAYTTSESLSSISFGLRFNIMSVKDIKKINAVIASEKAYIAGRDAYIAANRVAEILKINSTPEKQAIIAILVKDPDDSKLKNYKSQIDTEARNSLMDTYDKANKSTFDKLSKDFNKYYNHKCFTWDMALGASENFPENQIDTGRLGRYGVWSTAKYSWMLEDNFLNIYGYGRYLKDESQIDAISLDYITNDYLDFGGKLEFQYNKFSIAAEYINRNGDDKDFRLVGTLQFKIQDNLYLTGGYGKNFNADSGNLMTLFGLKWGLNEKPMIKK